MKTKILAILAVLAFAFAGAAVVTAEQGDAANALTVDSTMDMTAIGVGETSNLTVTAIAEGVQIHVTSSSTDVVTVVDPAPTAATSFTTTVTVTKVAAGEATLTFTAEGYDAATTTVYAGIISITPQYTDITAIQGSEKTLSFTVKGAYNATLTATPANTTLIPSATAVVEDGVGTLTFTPAEDTYGITTITIASGDIDATVDVAVYDSTDDAKIIAYAQNDAKTIKMIVYSDGLALVDFKGLKDGDDAYKGTKINAHLSDEAGIEGADVVLLTFKDRTFLDLSGYLDVSTPANAKVTFGGYDATLANVVLTPAEYTLTLNGNSGFFDDERTVDEYTLTATDLKRGNITKTTTDPANTGIADPEKTGWTLLGYALAAADASTAEVVADPMQTDGNKIEDFVFAVGAGDASNKVYAIWDKTTLQIWLTNSTTAGDESVQQHLAVANAFDAYAPRTYITDDVALLRIVQNGTAAGTKAYTINVYKLADWNATEAAAVPADHSLKMLTNGLYVLTDLKESVVISIQAATGTFDSFQMSVRSVDNTVSSNVPTGKAVVDFTAFDMVPAGTIDIEGTYVKFIDGQYVYGAIGGAAAPITLTATEDQVAVEDATITGTVLTLAENHQTYRLTYDGDANVGFYAIKAAFVNGDVKYTTEYTLGSF